MSSSNDNRDKAGAAPAVGYCSPPSEHQWPRGWSGNPAGRPRRKVVEMKMPPGLTPIQRKVLNHANTVAGEVSGKPVTNFDQVLLTMKAHAPSRPEFAKMLFQMYEEASEADHEFRMTVLAEALHHKEVWGPKFELARKLGKRPPNVYPRPDDIVILADGTVKIFGPINADEARRLNQVLKLRDNAFEIAREVIAEAGKRFSIEQAKEMWLAIRAQYYTYSQLIPRRNRPTFPAFKPSFPGQADEDNS